MKSFMVHSILAAAAVAALIGSASAQTLTAEIPFAFRAGQTLMAPGSYDVKTDRSGAVTVFYFHNADSHKSILLPTYYRTDPPKAWAADGHPRLSFECVETRCALRQIWMGDSPAYAFRGPRHGADGALRLTEIPLTRTPSF